MKGNSLISGVIVATLAAGMALSTPSRGAGAGAVEGRVTLLAAIPPPERIQVTRGQDICGAEQSRQMFVVSESSHGLRDVVILIDVPGAEAPYAVDSRLEQEGCRYTPHVQAVSRGSTLEIVNLDPTLHNVHAYRIEGEDERNTLFNIAQVNNTPTAKKSITMDKAGVYEFDCDVHPWMRSFVVVSDNDFYATTDEDGHYRIDGIPPGTYTMTLWHEGLGSFPQEVAIVAGEIEVLDFPIEPNE